ncbi:MAG: DUF3108 domain-containing protein [Bacteroidota bacterium]
MRPFLTLSLTMLIAFSACAQGKGADTSSPVFRDGEVLQYKVKWTVFRLGTVTLRTFRNSACTGPNDYKVAFQAESNPDISIICVRGYYESTMDAASLVSKGIWGLERTRETFIETRANLDEETGRLTYIVVDKNADETLHEGMLENITTAHQSASLLAFARSVSHTMGLYRLPSFVDRKMGTTEIIFRGEKEDLEISAMEAPIRTRVVDGETKWGERKGVAGFAGNFKGWFSDDDAAVPIRAEAKVIVGSIVVELEQWDRPGWVPPTAAEATARK